MHSLRNRLVIVGAGGAGAEALWVAGRMMRSCGECSWEIVGFADDNPAIVGQLIDGCRVLGSVDGVIADFRNESICFHCAIGSNRVKRLIVDKFESAGFLPATLVDPTAVISGSASIGLGSYIGPQSNVSPFARIGRHVLINTQVSVGHHAQIAGFSQLCPGARVSGLAQVAEGGFVGSNAVLAPGVEIGAWSVLGAASFALKNVPAECTAIGNPARIVLK